MKLIVASPLLRGLSAFVLWMLLAIAATGCAPLNRTPLQLVGKWDRFEIALQSSATYINPVQDVRLEVVFTGPSGEVRKVNGFWDGEGVWRARFSPPEVGQWRYESYCSDRENRGLHLQRGSFLCTAAPGRNLFTQHGPVRISRDGRSFEHEDGTPFFWMGDTAWSGPLLASAEEWEYYLSRRSAQGFNAVQWVATQFRAAPAGDREGQLAWIGEERVSVNPRFFQRLDERLDAMNRAGMLGVPVLLWDNGGRINPRSSPGTSLKESQLVVLANYMVARWGAHHVVWILNGDGDYRGLRAERWRRIGRQVFGNITHAPVTLHPGGRQWVLPHFRDESWLGINGYQSGHNDSEDNLRWIHSGPAGAEWRIPPTRPFISLEAPYENHLGSDRKPISAFVVRRAHYWSLLSVPTCGVTYGGHGVWGWDDGTQPPYDHPYTGTPLHWSKALEMEGAKQMSILAGFFRSIDFASLRPAPQILVNQPGQHSAREFAAASQNGDRSLTVIYLPGENGIEVVRRELPSEFHASWLDPRNGAVEKAKASGDEGGNLRFSPPGVGDWVLKITKQ